jgi:DNA-directed RNA polymerase subunit RPC12/RpoP
MTDFEPTTDLPDRIDEDDTPVDSTARSRDRAIQTRRKRVLQALTVVTTLGLIAIGLPWLRVLVAMAIGYVILVVGIAVLGAFARPVPEPPPPGELRRVKLTYRCTTCGTELRMTLANDSIPQAPRHCADEMELTTAAEDL